MPNSNKFLKLVSIWIQVPYPSVSINRDTTSVELCVRQQYLSLYRKGTNCSRTLLYVSNHRLDTTLSVFPSLYLCSKCLTQKMFLKSVSINPDTTSVDLSGLQ